VIYDRVTDADAIALAEALKRALPDVPRHDALAGHPDRTLRWSYRAIGGPFLSAPPSLYEWFSGENRQMIEEVITLAGQGSFQAEDPTVRPRQGLSTESADEPRQRD
jgi:hypothetical protein